ncbi:DnaJ domain protein [Cryptosporidium meleagridis]|uniref:DnaJ homolog subfamily C member 10 n=1 Tax=Cryptosporidium meleagridis TaxID=93969 RepID=A0A2P4YZD0_9CRYT|nr:DnaJ domain protein [Cryptosporidium meleagridis]
MLCVLFVLKLVLLIVIPVIAGKDYYKILGVPRNANENQIKRAYRKLSLKYHPDKNPGSKEKFMEVANAYEVLVNPETRRKYDAFGEEGLKSEGFSGGDGGFDFGGFSGFSGFGGFGDFGGFKFSAGGNTFHFGGGGPFGFGGGGGRRQGTNSRSHFESQGSSYNNLYSDSKHVTELSTMSAGEIKDKIKSREWVMIVNFYRPGCGPCKQLVQAYGNLAKLMSQYDVEFGAVNCDTHFQLCQSYNIERYPHLSMFIKGKNSQIVFNPSPGSKNPYSESNIGKWITEKMPDHSMRLNSYNQAIQWLRLGKHIPKAVLFTNKDSSSPLLKKIAKDFQNRLNLAIVSINNDWLKKIFFASPHMEASKPEKPPYILSVDEITESGNKVGGKGTDLPSVTASGEWISLNTISHDVITLTLSRIVGSFRARKQHDINEALKSKVRELNFELVTSKGFCSETDSRFCVILIMEKNDFRMDKRFEDLSFKYRNDPINFFWISAFRNGKNSHFLDTFKCHSEFSPSSKTCIAIYRAKRRKFQTFDNLEQLPKFIDGLLDGSHSPSSSIPRSTPIPVPAESEPTASHQNDEEDHEYSDSEDSDYGQEGSRDEL